MLSIVVAVQDISLDISHVRALLSHSAKNQVGLQTFSKQRTCTESVTALPRNPYACLVAATQSCRGVGVNPAWPFATCSQRQRVWSTQCIVRRFDRPSPFLWLRHVFTQSVIQLSDCMQLYPVASSPRHRVYHGTFTAGSPCWRRGATASSRGTKSVNFLSGSCSRMQRCPKLTCARSGQSSPTLPTWAICSSCQRASNHAWSSSTRATTSRRRRTSF